MDNPYPPADFGLGQDDFTPFDYDELEPTSYASDLAGPLDFASPEFSLADPALPFNDVALPALSEYGPFDNVTTYDTVDPGLLSMPYFPMGITDSLNQGFLSTGDTPTVNASICNNDAEEPMPSAVNYGAFPTASNDTLAVGPATSRTGTDLIHHSGILQQNPAPPANQMT